MHLWYSAWDFCFYHSFIIGIHLKRRKDMASNILVPMTELFHRIHDMFDYSVDAFQRSVLFMDILRKRGNIYEKIIQT